MQTWEIIVLICLLTLCCTMSYVAGRLHQQLKDDKDELNQLRRKEYLHKQAEFYNRNIIYGAYHGGATHASRFAYQDTDGLNIKEEKHEKL